MRKFLILLAVVCLMVGLRLNYNGLAALGNDGRFTVFHKGGEITVYDDGTPVFGKWGTPTRLDISGGLAEAKEAMETLGAKILFTEDFDGLTVFYAFTTRLLGGESVKGYRINLMVAVSDAGVAIGTPILKGSY